MADVTEVIAAASFSHKTHRNLSEEVEKVLQEPYNSKKRLHESGESIRPNLEKDVNSMVDSHTMVW
ncbi:hypothetical protein Bca52824_056773 [Brassica carinata]|uniref:Uncharacterized protein n=1 Tax=Brassica carinata TaxID=52824 RepID=A0A8X7QUY8_BRACI|nr:hypothetical protein Bca52824_056773 [Brassica carinata]